MEESKLKIVQLERYDRPKYPRFGQYVRPPKSVLRAACDVAPLAAMAALLESCFPFGTRGVPPPPKFISETEARMVIDRAFAAMDVTLRPDVDLTIKFAAGDSAHLALDGYNDSLRIGYEYISGEDNQTFTPGIYNRLNDTRYDTKPSILILQTEFDKDAYQEHLERAVWDYLDSLRAHGVI